MEARRALGPGPEGGGTTASRSSLVLAITYLPLGLVIAMVGWTVTALVFVPGAAAVGAIVLLVSAIALGVLGSVREGPYAGMTAIFLVAATFFSMGIFLASLGLGELFAFTGVSIFTIQVTRFRTMVRPFLVSASQTDREGLRRVYITFLQRLGFLIILVVLLSLVLYTAGTAARFEIPSELAVFLLGISILVAFLLMARLRAGE